MNKPHKHCEVIKAWADGKKIQWWDFNNNKWRDVTSTASPLWREDQRYRIKPEPKKLFARCWKTSRGHISCITTVSKDNIGESDYQWISDWVEIELYSKDEEE